ncbi:hypothetical protein E2C01_024098 [Portunus trituberculatus]|uniref:Uncharacterized protein n=1 Tax=Portunus trituberculatus TaxID=210409 RepID=A0A5B7EBS5_PORTR|nr:hypothetical protein [Portunus trituberculatus]
MCLCLAHKPPRPPPRPLPMPRFTPPPHTAPTTTTPNDSCTNSLPHLSPISLFLHLLTPALRLLSQRLLSLHIFSLGSSQLLCTLLPSPPRDARPRPSPGRLVPQTVPGNTPLFMSRLYTPFSFPILILCATPRF